MVIIDVNNNLLEKIQRYIVENYVEESFQSKEFCLYSRLSKSISDDFDDHCLNDSEADFLDFASLDFRNDCSSSSSRRISIRDKVLKVEETWQQMLFKLIDERNMKDPEVYKRANISKQTFSKIRSDINYQPNKETSIQICIGLMLNIDDSLDLLKKAGYSLSNSIKRDLVVRYFIENKIYNMDELNSVLYELEMKLFPIN